MKITPSLILLLTTFHLNVANCYQPPNLIGSDGAAENVQIPDESSNWDKLREKRQQQNLFGQLLTSIQGILSQQTTKPPLLLEDILMLPQAPNESKRPGTTNNGGIVNQVVAVASGISSGLFGVLGVNTGPNVVAFLNYRTSPRPSSSGIGNNNLPGSNNGQLGDLSIGENKTNPPSGHENIFSSLNFPSPAPILDIVGEIFGHKPGGTGVASSTGSCTDIRRLLGQCL